MNKFFICISCMLLLLCFATACYIDVYEGKRPIDYPNTRWVSESPDMYFEVGDSWVDTYSQIVINDEVIELIINFDPGALVFFDDPSGFDPNTGLIMPGVNSKENNFFSGLCRFRPDRMVVYSIRNDKGFLDDSIKEIVFIREDIVSEEGEP